MSLLAGGLVKGYVIVKCGGNEYVLSPGLYSLIVNAYYDGRLVASSKCEFKVLINGALITIILPNVFSFRYNNRFVFFCDPERFLYDIVFENFYGGAYNALSVRGKTVVDVGGQC